MNPLLITTIAQLDREHGHSVDLALDFDDIKNLDALADAVTTPEKSLDYKAALWPSLALGGATFTRLSIGVEDFLEEYPRKWYAEAGKLNNYSTFYCLAHAAESELIWEFHNNRRGWEKALAAWRRTLTVDYTTLCDRISEFLLEDERAQIDVIKRLSTPPTQGPPKGQQPKPSRDLGWLIDTLLAEYGGTVQYWVWEAPIDHVRLCLDNHRKRKQKERREAGDTASDPDDPRIKSLRLFRHAESSFIEKIVERNSEPAPQAAKPKELATNGQ